MSIHAGDSLADDMYSVDIPFTNGNNALLWPVELELHVLRDCMRRLIIHVEGSFEELGIVVNYYLLGKTWWRFLDQVYHFFLTEL